MPGLMFVASASGDFNGVYVSPHPFVSATLAAPPFSCPICSNPKEAHPTARDCISAQKKAPLRSPDEDIGSSRRASKATKDQQAGSKDSTGTPLRVELEDRRKSKAMEAATERPRSEGTSGEPSGGPATPSKAREENPKRPRRESSAAKSPSYGRTRDTRASLEAKLAVEIETNMPLSKKVGRSTNNVSRDRCAEQATSQDKPQIKGAGREKRVLERHPAPTTQAHGKSLETRNMEESPGHCESRVTTRNQARMREQESQFSPSLPESPNTPSLSEREIFSALTWPAFSQEHSQLALMKTLCRPVDELIRDLRSITNQVGVPRDQTTRE
uniref:Uncharacterized protein n=1 Tax=Rhodosorus marinus TaxID=101924 RepID=A0A7S3ED85_9RHOD|mmetsp:Transcript_26922/g.104491  ORF Transcript_26922/g.104491 Transcript_26922/m.104491 type:complete len:329 (+) Transcript_26922:702-1688(+)